MKLVIAAIIIFILGVLNTPMMAHAKTSNQITSAQAIKMKLIRAKYNLQRLDAEIAERSSDHAVMNELMPHDDYVGGSYFEEGIQENKAFLKKLILKREQMKKAMAYYERQYGFGPEIYKNRAVATNPYADSMGHNN